ncbi:hypothetical protein ACJJTC_012173 [Scirpophaga incertulas]
MRMFGGSGERVRRGAGGVNELAEGEGRRDQLCLGGDMPCCDSRSPSRLGVLKAAKKPPELRQVTNSRAYLSKNRFSDVPDEVTTYLYLEKLLLSQNVLRSVPCSVGGLQSLTYLDIR